MKKFITALLATIFILAPVPNIIQAASGTAGGQTSSLTVVMKFNNTQLEGIKVAVCQVAEVGTVNGRSAYQTETPFSGANADFTNLDIDSNIKLAKSLNDYALANNIAQDVKTTDVNGKVTYTGLASGLYLVAQADGENSEYVFAPYLISLPGVDDITGNLNYNVTAEPKTKILMQSNETVAISGGKYWYHRTRDENVYIPENEKPTSITLYILADGQNVFQKQITSADNWSWNVQMPKYAADGHEIVYTVNEARIEDYRKWTAGTNGYDLINEYSPGDNTEDIPDVPPPLAYPPDDGPGGPMKPQNSPVTYDTANMQLWIMLAVTGFLGLIGALYILNSKRFSKILKLR